MFRRDNNSQRSSYTVLSKLSIIECLPAATLRGLEHAVTAIHRRMYQYVNMPAQQSDIVLRFTVDFCDKVIYIAHYI